MSRYPADPPRELTEPLGHAAEDTAATVDGASDSDLLITEDGPAARINVRLPEQLKAAIEEAAAKEGRSVNAWSERPPPVTGPKARAFDFSRKTRSVDVSTELPSGAQVSAVIQIGDVRSAGWLGECRFKTGAGYAWLGRTSKRFHATSLVAWKHAVRDAWAGHRGPPGPG